MSAIGPLLVLYCIIICSGNMHESLNYRYNLLFQLLQNVGLQLCIYNGCGDWSREL